MTPPPLIMKSSTTTVPASRNGRSISRSGHGRPPPTGSRPLLTDVPSSASHTDRARGRLSTCSLPRNGNARRCRCLSTAAGSDRWSLPRSVSSRAARYPQVPGATDFEPEGERGWASALAPTYWGLAPQDYCEAADVWPLDPDGELLLMGIVENVRGINTLPDILRQVKGIGAIWAGPGDLSVSMGLRGNATHPDVEAGVQKILAICQQRGRALCDGHHAGRQGGNPAGTGLPHRHHPTDAVAGQLAPRSPGGRARCLAPPQAGRCRVDAPQTVRWHGVTGQRPVRSHGSWGLITWRQFSDRGSAA